MQGTNGRHSSCISNLGTDISQFGEELLQTLPFQLRQKPIGADRRSLSPRLLISAMTVS